MQVVNRLDQVPQVILESIFGYLHLEDQARYLRISKAYGRFAEKWLNRLLARPFQKEWWMTPSPSSFKRMGKKMHIHLHGTMQEIYLKERMHSIETVIAIGNRILVEGDRICWLLDGKSQKIANLSSVFFHVAGVCDLLGSSQRSSCSGTSPFSCLPTDGQFDRWCLGRNGFGFGSSPTSSPDDSFLHQNRETNSIV